MPTDKPIRTVPAIAQTIDSVLSTPPAKQQQAVRPLAKLRPSWIGPPPTDRPRTPGPAMEQHVNVEYSSPGLKPPVYIFTSLSEPQWEAVEMEAEKNEKGDFVFSKAFDVEEGEYQYKFRLGPGDWWVCDESRHTVDDGMGNKNNLLVVKTPDKKLPQPWTEMKDVKTVAILPAAKPPALVLPIQLPQSYTAMTPAPSELDAPTPMPKVEAFVLSRGSESQHTPDRDADDPLIDESTPDDLDNIASDTKDTSESSDSESSSSFDTDDEGTQSPLLRHESVTMHTHEQEHAPLFRHESIALGYNHHEPPAPAAETHNTSSKPVQPPHIHIKGDPNNPNLEHFPTDHAGILERIHRASITLPEDQDAFRSSPESEALSESPISPISLPSVEEGDEDMEQIRDAEEQEYEKEQESGEEMDPLREGEPETEPEDDGFEPKVLEDDILIEQTIVVEVIERRRSRVDSVVEAVGGRNGVM